MKKTNREIKTIECPDCFGYGSHLNEDDSENVLCLKCGGKGRIEYRIPPKPEKAICHFPGLDLGSPPPDHHSFDIGGEG